MGEKKVVFRKWKAIGKGLGPAVGAYFAAHMAGVNLGDIIADPEGTLPVIASTFLAGLIPVIINVIKHKGAPGNPLPLLPFLLFLGGVALVPGCVTTTHPDGSVTQSVDTQAVAGIVQTGYTYWETLDARHRNLEAAREEARDKKDLARIAVIDKELDRLAPELARAKAELDRRVAAAGDRSPH